MYHNLYCGVEHCNLDDNSEQIHLLVLKKKKHSLLIENTKTISTVNELTKYIKSQQHLYLVINTDAVLTKKIEGVFDFEKAIIKTFSNVNRNDFYIEVLKTKKNTFVAICRKDVVDSILEKYQKQHLNVVGFSLGNLISSTLGILINTAQLNTSNAVIEFKNEELTALQLTEINSNNDRYNINGLEINSNQILSFSGIISYYTENRLTQTNYQNVLIKLNNDFKQKKVFELGLKIGLSFIFTLLLFSFLFFSQYQSKINELLSKNQVNENLKISLLKLKEKTEKKKKLFNEVTNATNSRVSFYLDKIGNTLPISVLLTALNYQPKQKSIKKNKEILVRVNSIIIKGKSTDSKAFSNWIETLEKKYWIDNVSITNYGTGKQKTTTFELKLNLKQ